MAARRALKFAKEIWVDQVILEGDSEILIKVLKSSSSSLSSYGHIAQDMQYLASCFSKMCFSHVRRYYNSITHSPVRRVVFSLHFLVWMENVGANTIIMEIIHKEKLNSTLNIIDVKKEILL